MTNEKDNRAKSDEKRPYEPPKLTLVDLLQLGKEHADKEQKGKFVVAQAVVSTSNVTGGAIFTAGAPPPPLRDR